MGNYDDGGDSAESARCFYGIMTVGEFAAHRVGDQGLFGDPPLSRMTFGSFAARRSPVTRIGKLPQGARKRELLQ